MLEGEETSPQAFKIFKVSGEIMALHSITSGRTQCLRMVQLIVLSFPWGKPRSFRVTLNLGRRCRTRECALLFCRVKQMSTASPGSWRKGKGRRALVLCFQDGLFPLLTTVLGKAVPWLIALKKE